MTIDEGDKAATHISASINPDTELEPKMSSIEEEFQKAVEYVNTLPKQGPYKPSNDTRLLFYGWYKQAKVGVCTGKRPGFFRFVDRAKYDAWHKLENMTKEDAMQAYVSEFKKTKSAFEDRAGSQGS